MTQQEAVLTRDGKGRMPDGATCYRIMDVRAWVRADGPAIWEPSRRIYNEEWRPTP